MKLFPPHLTDFYKTGHIYQYPDKTQRTYSNMTARSSRLAKMLPDYDNQVVVAGIQGTAQWFLRDLWNDNFFKQPREAVIRKYQRRMDTSLGPNLVGTEHIAALHDLGYLPLLIRALPEGSRVPIKVPFLTVENTHEEFGWLTNYVETALSSEIWKSVNVATIAYEFRRLLDKAAAETGAYKDFVSVQAHDFSFRGMSGIHDAAAHGIGHLFSFTGSDNIPAIDFVEDYYAPNDAGTYLGGGVPATEHSVMCLGGKDTEMETYRRLIVDIYHTGIVSIVSDTWDYWNVLTNFTRALREEILNRKPNEVGLAKVVFRPDSGDPEKIICGDPEAEPGSPAHKGSLELLWEVFGGTTNEMGFRQLNPAVGLIYGDSITLTRAESILRNMKSQGWASDNVVFGVGSYTYQYHTRDTFGQAIKTTWGQVDGKGIAVMKDPITDRGDKKSAQGLLRVEWDAAQNRYVLFDNQTPEQAAGGALRPVFLNGDVLNVEPIETIRNRLLG